MVGETVEEALLRYLEIRFLSDEPLSVKVIHEILPRVPDDSLTWKRRGEDGLPLLHMVVMNESTLPDELSAIIEELLRHGAPVSAVDNDNDTALDAVLQLADDAAQEDDLDEETLLTAKQANRASVQTLLRCPDLLVGKTEARRVCTWLSRHVSAEAERQSVLEVLAERVGQNVVTSCMMSEKLLSYLTQCAYDDKCGVDPRQVAEFLERGVVPSHNNHGATSLLLVVLNPYTSYDALRQVIHLLLTKEPEVASIRDGFGLTALQWAVDYENVSQQHGLPTANPATLLALLPALVRLLPAEVDAGECCVKVGASGACSDVGVGPVRRPTPRFLEGDRVKCRVAVPGGVCNWEEGVVVGLWYREKCWPADHIGAPYEVLLDLGHRVYSLVDHDRVVRQLGASKLSSKFTPAPRVAAAASAPPPASPARAVEPAVFRSARVADAAAPRSRPRFQRRQGEDGTWEMLDDVSGKARPCSPPDSDED